MYTLFSLTYFVLLFRVFVPDYYNHIILCVIPSITLMSKVQDAVLPDGSTKMYVTSVVPILKNCPTWWVWLARLAVPELSIAVAVCQVTSSVPPVLQAVVTVWSCGQVTTGGTLSTIEWEDTEYWSWYMCYMHQIFDYLIMPIWSQLRTFDNSNIKIV